MLEVNSVTLLDAQHPLATAKCTPHNTVCIMLPNILIPVMKFCSAAFKPLETGHSQVTPAA